MQHKKSCLSGIIFFFTLLISTTYFATPTVFVEPEDGLAPVIERIASAKQSIRLEIYMITNSKVINALKQAAQRGVDVRVIMEEHLFDAKQVDVYKIRQDLEDGGVKVSWANDHKFTFTHEKSMVIDGETNQGVALIMTLNQTNSAFANNREYGIVSDNQEDIREFIRVFESDWQWSEPPVPISESTRLVWSPLNSRAQILKIIGSATKSLYIEVEEINDEYSPNEKYEIENAIIDRVEDGVKVYLLTPPPSARMQVSETMLQNAGVNVRNLAKSTTPPVELYIHAKLIIADGQRVYIGSENLSSNSLDHNRELGILADDLEKSELHRLRHAFFTDWAHSTPYSTPEILNPTSVPHTGSPAQPSY